MQKRLADFFKALVERKNIVRYCSIGVGVRWYALYCVRCAGGVRGVCMCLCTVLVIEQEWCDVLVLIIFVVSGMTPRLFFLTRRVWSWVVS